MDNAFRDTVIEELEKMTPEQKQALLTALKFRPHVATLYFSERLADWMDTTTQKTGDVISFPSISGVCDEITSWLQQHFAKEMELI